MADFQILPSLLEPEDLIFGVDTIRLDSVSLSLFLDHVKIAQLRWKQRVRSAMEARGGCLDGPLVCCPSSHKVDILMLFVRMQYQIFVPILLLQAVNLFW